MHLKKYDTNVMNSNSLIELMDFNYFRCPDVVRKPKT